MEEREKNRKRRATLVGDDEVKSVEDVRLMMEDAKVTNHQHQQKKCIRELLDTFWCE